MSEAHQKTVPQIPHRFLTLDMMRGYFIAIIIVNHLWRWPNAFIVVSGSNQLWFSGAEGFVILSGFLIGYVRGFKARDLPFVELTKKLFRRSGLLYIWFVVMTIILTLVAWNVTFVAPNAWILIEQNNYLRLITDTLLLLNAHNWVHFLWLYAVLIFGSPILLLLLRKNLTIITLAIIAALHLVGNEYGIEWMKWAPIFYLPLVFGYHLPTIAAWWHTFRYRQALRITAMAATIAILVTSAVFVFYLYNLPGISEINTYFSKDGSITVGRLAVAAICFIGIYFIFDKAYAWIDKYFGWLLRPFGNWSLAIYALHGFIVTALAVTIPKSDSIVVNTLVTLLALFLVWGLVAVKPLHRILPR